MLKDSQYPDYLDVLHSLLASRKEWQQSPEIVNLSVKAIAHLLHQFNEQFQEHKTLINEQSLQLKQFQLELQRMPHSKHRKAEAMSGLPSPSRDPDDSISEYQKLIKESIAEPERMPPPTLEELKTIADIVSQKHHEQLRKEVTIQLSEERQEVEGRIATLKEEIQSRMMGFERDRRQLASECRQAHSRIEESQIRDSHLQQDSKIGELEQSGKRMGERLNSLVLRLQQGYLTREEVNLLLEQAREKKSPQRSRSKESQQRQLSQAQLNQEIEKGLTRFKNEERSEWREFKHGVLKEMGKMVNSETVNRLLSTFQKDLLDKQQACSSALSALEKKVATLATGGDHREALVKSQKRPEKRSSPSKSVEVIQSSLDRLERTILQKQAQEVRKVEKDIEAKLELWDRTLAKELDRRERHLCQVIEETYSQQAREEGEGELKGALKKLFESNLECRYLYIGTRDCKKDSCIPWEKEALNNLTDNFTWKKDASLIVVNSPGLYRLEVALFGETPSQTVVLLNGDPLADIPRPPNPRSTAPKVRGALFSELVLLPGKSRVSVRVGEQFYGQAFLGLVRM